MYVRCVVYVVMCFRCVVNVVMYVRYVVYLVMYVMYRGIYTLLLLLFLLLYVRLCEYHMAYIDIFTTGTKR